MTFPVKNEYPTYELTVPSSGKKARYRPFLSKEEKILLIAREGESKDILYAVKQVITNCFIDRNIDVETLAPFDIDYIFIQLRAKSINNIVALPYRDKEDNKVYNHEVDLNEVKVEFNPEHTNKIKINDNCGIIMKYPGTTLPDYILNASNEVEILFGIIKMCLDKVYDGEEMYNFNDYPDDDVEDFLNTLSVSTFNDVRKFLETLPKLKHTINYKNSLGNDRRIVLENLSDFFTLG